MRSDRKSAANRRNSCKSCGPRTAAGRATASRNALRHGLSAMVHRQPAPSAELERLARAICGHDENPTLLEQARVVAANELELRAINVQKIAVLERLRDPTAIALAKGDNSLELARGKFMRAWLAHREIEGLVPKVLEKYKDQISTPLDDEVDIVPICLKGLLEESDCIERERIARKLARKQIEEHQRDDHEALEEAAADLIRLDRYERRSWSRQKRAIRSFMNLMMSDIYPVATPGRSNDHLNPT